MFTSARIKLTAWYVLVILLITGSISSLIFFRTSRLLTRQFVAIENRWKEDHILVDPPQPTQIPLAKPYIFANELALAKVFLIKQLVTINISIAVLVAILGYILSGKTLEPIQRTYEEQKRFLGDAAHELRTPITALKTSLEVHLMDAKLPKSIKQLLQENLEDVSNLEHLTLSLLRLARHESMTKQITSIPLTELWHKVEKISKPLATKKQIQLDFQSSTSVKKIEGNRESLTDLFVVLIENAIKYSPPQTTIKVAITSSKKYVHVAVIDQGIGIAKHHLPHIFDRFYRVDSSRTKNESNGHGLGLSIAKKIVEEHYGSLKVSSMVNKGSTFSISLPLKQPA